jgi:hypothetical protein
VAGCAIALLLGCGVAQAYWPNGSGQAFGWGSTATGRVSATAATVSGLSAGAAPALVTVVVSNDGDAAFAVDVVRLDLGALPDTCPAEAWRQATPDDLPVLAPHTTANVGITVSLSADAPDGCQGQSLDLPVIISGGLR